MYYGMVENGIQTEKGGDVRKFGDEYYMVVRVRENDSKLMCSDGSCGWALNDVFLADEPSDMSVEDFLKMVLNFV